MKNRVSTLLTGLLVALLVFGAIFIGGVKGYKEEREELLLACMEMHAKSGTALERSIVQCEDAAADFDARLKYKWMGKLSAAFGVEPVSGTVQALHAQLIRNDTTAAQSPNLLSQLSGQISELLEDTIDTKLSWSKIFWTLVCLYTIFGKKARRKGFTLWKLLAGFHLFKLWKRK